MHIPSDATLNGIAEGCIAFMLMTLALILVRCAVELAIDARDHYRRRHMRRVERYLATGRRTVGR